MLKAIFTIEHYMYGKPVGLHSQEASSKFWDFMMRVFVNANKRSE